MKVAGLRQCAYRLRVCLLDQCRLDSLDCFFALRAPAPQARRKESTWSGYRQRREVILAVAGWKLTNRASLCQERRTCKGRTPKNCNNKPRAWVRRAPEIEAVAGKCSSATAYCSFCKVGGRNRRQSLRASSRRNAAQPASGGAPKIKSLKSKLFGNFASPFL